MKLAPKHVLIEVAKIEKSDSGVFLPDDNFISEKAKVIQVASDVTFCKKGDTILFKSYAPDYFTEEGDEFAIIEERFVKAVI